MLLAPQKAILEAIRAELRASIESRGATEAYAALVRDAAGDDVPTRHGEGLPNSIVEARPSRFVVCRLLVSSPAMGSINTVTVHAWPHPNRAPSPRPTR